MAVGDMNIQEMIKNKDWKSLRNANLRLTNLSGVDLTGANLGCSDLSSTNLRGVILIESNLRDADLSYADLHDACLRCANLRDVNLHGTIGNGHEIKSMQIERYPIAWTKDVLQIFCKQYYHKDWKKFTDNKISLMDDGALEWWRKYKTKLFDLIEGNK